MPPLVVVFKRPRLPARIQEGVVRIQRASVPVIHRIAMERVATGFGGVVHLRVGLPATGTTIRRYTIRSSRHSCNLCVRTQAGYALVSNGCTRAEVMDVASRRAGGLHHQIRWQRVPWRCGVLLERKRANANDTFLNAGGQPRPFENNNQWAASLGGPIKKDKAFFFINTEACATRSDRSSQVFVPTQGLQNFILNTSLPANNPAAIPFYQQIFNLYNNAPGVANAQACRVIRAAA